MPHEPVQSLSPIHFAEKVGVQLWPKMLEIFQAVQDGKRKILVRSCNGAGKTTAIAALCNWKLTQFNEAIVLTTASSWTQVRRTLWGEIRRQARVAQLYPNTRITKTSIPLDEKLYALGISPSIPENAQGFHSPHMLIVVDEATGVDREIIDALSGNLTGEDAQIILICNPINTKSYPYEAEESGDWHLITISALEHPNVTSGNEEIRGAVTRKWIEDRLKSWSHEIEAPEDSGKRVVDNGEPPDESVDSLFHSPHPTTSSSYAIGNALYIHWLNKWFQKSSIVASRILGEWADNEANGYITMDLVQRCMDSHRDSEYVLPNAPKILGVDIARSGPDATVLARFDGATQLPLIEFYHQDLMTTAQRIKDQYDLGYHIIAIDDSGLGGGVSDRLNQIGVPHHAVNFNQKPRGVLHNRKELANARAEMYFTLEEDIRECEIQLLDDKRLHQEITAVRLTTVANSTAYKLEDKELTRKRLGRSPDKADATALARYALRLEAYKKDYLI